MAKVRVRNRVRAGRFCGSLILALFRDETAVTTLEYVTAAVALALAAIAASRVIVGILIPYLHRIHLVVTLPIP